MWKSARIISVNLHDSFFIDLAKATFTLRSLDLPERVSPQPRFYFLPSAVSRELFGDRMALARTFVWSSRPLCARFAFHPLIHQGPHCFVVCTSGETGFSRPRSIFHCIGALKYPEEFHCLVTTPDGIMLIQRVAEVRMPVSDKLRTPGRKKERMLASVLSAWRKEEVGKEGWNGTPFVSAQKSLVAIATFVINFPEK